MAKKPEGPKYPFPSHFGSHSSMLTEEQPEDATLARCEDEFGVYETERKYLDTGMADPYRHRRSRLTKLFKSAKKTSEEE